MNTLTIKRALDDFIQDLWRNKWTSLGSILAMAMVLILTWLVAAVNDSSQRIIDRVEQKVDIAVFFAKDVPSYQSEAFLEELEGLQAEGKIRSFEYFSADHALEEMRRKFPEKVRFLERYQFENPLQASLEIIPGTWTPDDIFAFVTSERLHEVIDQKFFERYEEKKEEINKVLRLLSFFRKSGVFLITIFLIISGLLIGFFVSAILHQKKREIFIMRLVGAEHSFIRLPFILQGTALAVIAFLVSFVMFSLFLETVAPRVIQFFKSSSDQVFMSELVFEIQKDFQGSFWWYLFLLVLIAGLIGFATVERFIKKRHLLAEQ